MHEVYCHLDPQCFGRHDPPHGETETVWPKQRLAELQKNANTNPHTHATSKTFVPGQLTCNLTGGGNASLRWVRSMAVSVCGLVHIFSGCTVCSLPSFPALRSVACFISCPLQLPMTMDVALFLPQKVTLYCLPTDFLRKAPGAVFGS